MAPLASAAARSGSRGAFIVLEGVDRCGKTTQCKKLVETLRSRGLDAEMMRFPDRTTPVGKLIDAYLSTAADLDDGAVHTLFSANRWEARSTLLAKLAAGTTLVVDRYAYSGVAFTAAKRVSGLDAAWAAAPDAGLPAPDVVIYLDVPKEVAAARAGFGEERYEKAEFQERVRGVFQQLRDPSWVVVDAAQPIEDIHARVLQEALQVVERCKAGGEPVRQLWDRAPYAGPPAAGEAAAQGEANGGGAKTQ